MTCNWLTSAQLPTKYWYFGVKQACEVLNMLPLKKDNKITTPYELVHQKKVDYRDLFAMFVVSYIKNKHESGEGVKWKDKSLKCIIVGKCPISDSLLFYHMPTKQTLSCAENYRFDTSSPSGPQLYESYDSNFSFNTKSSIEDYYHTPTHETNKQKFMKDENGNYI